ncbi:MAG: patatin-like phospholipase family protein [Elusimicrobia bacterium]|nr:patatin-like phospholipase family protein [Elusimicrobiota bacterium]
MEYRAKSKICFFLIFLHSTFYILHSNLAWAEPIYSPAYDADELLETPSNREIAADLLWDVWKNLPSGQRGKTGLVLSGGGARGLAHVGVLRHLEETGFPIEALAATSMGALVGGVYAAAGMEKVEAMAEELGFSRLFRFGKSKFLKLALSDGTASAEQYVAWLRRALKAQTFEQTKIPLVVCATDLATGELVVLRDGELAPAIMGAATIPGLFSPISIRQHFLVDGGLLYNIPTEAVKLLDALNVLVVDVSARSYDKPMTRSPSALKALYRSIEIMGNKLEETTYSKGDYTLRFCPADMEIFELWRWREAVELGLHEARSNSVDMRLAFISKTIKALGPEFFASEKTALK